MGGRSQGYEVGSRELKYLSLNSIDNIRAQGGHNHVQS